MSRIRSVSTGLLAALMAICLVTFVGTAAQAQVSLSHHQKRMASHGVAAANQAGRATAPLSFRSAQGRFHGVFVPHSFQSDSSGAMTVTGEVIGKVKRPGHRAHWVDRQGVTVPVMAINGAPATTGGMSAPMATTCNVLNLVLGPLHLNLLGLNVDLNQVVLNITANPAGGLLGQLLCDVANLLSSGPLSGLLTQLGGLLNQILGQLSL